jgi:hypothetical protein
MRLPIATDLITRDGTLTKDANILNGFVEAGQAVFKRPSVNSVLATATGQAQGGIYNINSLGYFINGDVLKSYNSAFVLQATITL